MDVRFEELKLRNNTSLSWKVFVLRNVFLDFRQCTGVRFSGILLKKRTMNHTRKHAVVAGTSLLLMAGVAGFAYGYAFPLYEQLADLSLYPSKVGLFYAMIGAFGIVAVLDVIVAVKFRQFFSPVNPKQAMVQWLLRLIYTVFLIAGLGVLLTTNSNGSNLKANIALFQHIWMVGMVVFGLHLIVLSRLLCHTNRFPKFFTFMALFAGFAYVVTSLLLLSWEGYAAYKTTMESILALPMAAGELLLAFWLIIRGGKLPVTRDALANAAQ